MIILANDGLSQKGIDALLSAGHTLLNHRVAQEQLINFLNEHQVEVLLVRSATQVRKELIDQVPSLKIIGRGGVGMDNIDVEYAESKGINVINTPTASSRSVAEMVFAHFFSLARFLHDANRMMPLEGETQFNQLKKSYANAVELSGKTLGIIGFGGIGKEVAKMGIALGMKIKVATRKPRKEKIELSFFDGQKVQFEITTELANADFYKEIDFLSINTPKTNGYLLDAEQFEMMKDGVFIVNTARGGVLNEEALLHYIDTEKIAGAALDVFENEPQPELNILMHPQLSLSPHLGGSTIDAQEKIGLELAEQIINYSNNR
ncbi:NAD(P)-dependent oxidoreductase [Bergeyella zoohelcum]|uniref:D-3-phosphoglycerate dehydrogenase n=1 Tax=Bergeyella zoohelcum TaxID=1015 RepID=A0A7Z8YLJ2_9FLAO|nr:NAD(P)-dependent oxidoreductase [Bergeyella zoohelcum]VDH02597.1 D-3-phosphoglycerate dehydrogenase [Bergeyella zoohelcum]